MKHVVFAAIHSVKMRIYHIVSSAVAGSLTLSV